MIDDGSTDDSFGCVCDLIDNDSRIHIKHQSKQSYQLFNYVSMLKNPKFDLEDIIISIDADDWLPDPEVFDRILEAYSDNETWVTYGSFRASNDEFFIYGPLGGRASNIRKLTWKTSHLKTWKLWLWRLIREESFLDSDGSYLRCAGDLACMFPMIEMAGDFHSKWLKDINYVYNRENPLSCFRVRNDEQSVNAAWLRSQTPYNEIKFQKTNGETNGKSMLYQPYSS